jgi:hypothetical protein
MKSLLITKAFFIAAVSLARAGTMTDLGALPGGNYATANSLSPDGRTTGSGRTLPQV